MRVEVLLFLKKNECSIVHIWFLYWLKSLLFSWFEQSRFNVLPKVKKKNKKRRKIREFYTSVYVRAYIIFTDCNNFIIFLGLSQYWQRPVDISAEFKKNFNFSSYPIISIRVKGGTFIFWTFRKLLFTNQAQKMIFH